MIRFVLLLSVAVISGVPGCYPSAPDMHMERCYSTPVADCLPADKKVVGPLLSDDSHFKSVDSGPVLKSYSGTKCCYQFTTSSDGGLLVQNDCLYPTDAQEDAGVCPPQGEVLAKLNAKYHDTVVSVDAPGTLQTWTSYECCYQVTFKTDPP